MRTPLSRVLSACCMIALLGGAVSVTSCGPGGDNNQPPQVVLEPDGPERTYQIGDRVLITVLAQDPNNDNISFDWTFKTDNELSTVSTAQFIKAQTSATFRWTPDSADVTQADDPLRLIFIVTDAQGATTEREIKLTIVPGNGTPQFDSSANELYKNCCEEPISFKVKWRDDDTNELSLSMQNAPPGAMFDTTDSKEGRFTWTPTESEASKRIHSVVFVADDGQNAPVSQNVTIVIPPDGLGGNPANPGADVCAGEKVIEHTPLGPQRGDSEGFLVEATLTGAADRYDDAVLYWTDNDPTSSSTTIFSEKLTRADGKLTGIIPNVVLTRPTSLTLYYKICLLDTDASPDDATQLLCAPTLNDAFYPFNVYASPNDACLEDGLEALGDGNDTFETAEAMPRDSFDIFNVCEGNDDYFSVNVRNGQRIAIVAAYAEENDITLQLLDEDQNDVTNLLEETSCGLARAELEGTGSGQRYTLKVSGNEAVYALTSLELEAGGGCGDKANEPNTATADATPLPVGQTTENLEICPDGTDLDVYALDLMQGQRLTVTMNHMHSVSNLDMNLFPPSKRGEELERSGSGAVAFTFSSDTDDESFDVDIRACGTHYLQIFNNNENTAPYSLDVQVADAACQDTDEFTCNHTRDEAALYAWNQTYKLNLCGKGEDWFKHRGASATILGELVVTEGDPSDVSVDIYNFAGEKVGTTSSSATGVDFEATFPDDDFYFFRIKSSSDVSYDLLVID